MNKEEVLELMKVIKPGSKVFVWGSGFVSKVIRSYSQWELDVEEKDTVFKRVRGFFKILLKKAIPDLPSHVEDYLGGGNHQTISAEASGIKEMNLDRYIGKKYKIQVFSYNDMTVNQLQIVKAFLRGNLDKLYDLRGLVSFLGNIVKKKISSWKFANFCSELSAMASAEAGIQICSRGIKPEKQTPASQWNYIRKSKNWTLDFEYDNLK